MACFEKDARVVATDDRNAIRACKMLHLEFITAIAFLIRAFEKDFSKEMKPLLKCRGFQILADTVKQ